MKKPTMSAFMAAGLLWFALCTSDARAQESGQQGIPSLVGITAMGIVIEDLLPAVEQEGLTAGQIRHDVEQKLRAAGINIRHEDELAKIPGMPYLYVNIFTFKDEEDLYAYHITLELKQMVALVRKPAVKQSVGTWKISGGGTVGARKLGNIRTFVAEYTDAFIKAYRAANPAPL